MAGKTNIRCHHVPPPRARQAARTCTIRTSDQHKLCILLLLLLLLLLQYEPDYVINLGRSLELVQPYLDESLVELARACLVSGLPLDRSSPTSVLLPPARAPGDLPMRNTPVVLVIHAPGLLILSLVLSALVSTTGVMGPGSTQHKFNHKDNNSGIHAAV